MAGLITNAENASEFRSLRSFSVSDSSLFRAGINELRFEVNNEGSAIYPDKSSTGLYVNASVCESKSQEPEAVPPEPEKKFEITNVTHPRNVLNGGPVEDLVVFWEGDPKFPVTVTYKPKPGWNCPQGGCVTVSHTYYESKKPFVFKGALWCRGYRKSCIFDYEVILKDATGKETSPVPAGFRCVVQKADKTEDSPFDDDKNFSDFLTQLQDKEDDRSHDQQDRVAADMATQFADTKDEFGPQSLGDKIDDTFKDKGKPPDDDKGKPPDDDKGKPPDEEPPKTVTGVWKFHARCKDKNTDVAAFNITLNEIEGGAFSGGGSGKDYDGKGMKVQLSGTYNSKSYLLKGQIITNFDDTKCVRKDTFNVYLKSSDTGYFSDKADTEVRL